MPKIDISDETYAKIKHQLTTDDEPVEIKSLDDLVGRSWFFRTVTYHIVGRVVRLLGTEDCKLIIVLESASWVADSGRFMNAIEDGTLSEVEPLGQWCVNMDTVTDFGPWRHPLPMEQK